MNDPPSSGDVASPQEQDHLERAHHEICTALTILRSNVELVRVELWVGSDPAAHLVVQRHLSELDLAVDRLRRLAVQMRAWHAEEASDTPGVPGAPERARLLP